MNGSTSGTTYAPVVNFSGYLMPGRIDQLDEVGREAVQGLGHLGHVAAIGLRLERRLLIRLADRVDAEVAALGLVACQRFTSAGFCSG